MAETVRAGEQEKMDFLFTQGKGAAEVAFDLTTASTIKLWRLSDADVWDSTNLVGAGGLLTARSLVARLP